MVFFLIENQWCFYYYDWHSFDPKRDGLSKLSNQSFIDKNKLILIIKNYEKMPFVVSTYTLGSQLICFLHFGKS